MACVTVSKPMFYAGGMAGVSPVLGYESGRTRVVRYSFTAPAVGASAISFTLANFQKGAGDNIPIAFFVGTEPLSHTDPELTDRRTGTFSLSGTQVQVGAEAMLLPGKTYYLWLFPGEETFGWWFFDSAVLTLTTLGAAASRLRIPEGVHSLGQTLEIGVDRASPSYTHTLYLALGSAKQELGSGIEEKIQCVLPLEMAAQLPRQVRATGVMGCRTYEGDTLLGETTAQVEVAVPESVVPTVSAVWTDESGAYGILGRPVQNVSRLRLAVDARGALGSTVTETTATLDGQPYTAGVLTTAGTQVLQVTVTDSRDRTASWRESLSVAAYESPTLTLNASRCTQEGQPDETGAWANITLSGQIWPLEGNRGTLKLTCGTQSREFLLEAGAFTQRVILSAPSENSFVISAQLQDLLCSVSREMTLSVGYATMDLLAGGKGIAFGTTATREGFLCAMDTDMLGHPLVGLPQPRQEDAAATKAYVDEKSGSFETDESLSLRDGVLGVVTAGVEDSPLPVRASAVKEALAGKSVKLQAEAGTAAAISIGEGELWALSYQTSYTGAGDIYLKVNGAAPTVSGYSFSGSTQNFTGGQITYSGSTTYAAFHGFARLLEGRLTVWGQDIRGNGTGHGQSILVWKDVSQVEGLTFTRAGSLICQRL